MDTANSSRRRLNGVFLWFVFFTALVFASPSSAQMEMPSAEDLCRSTVNTDPWSAGTAQASPGRWWNPKRYGTGWDLVYNDDKTKLKAFFYTFNSKGHSTWLATRMTALPKFADRWKADLLEYNDGPGGPTPTVVGEVIFVFSYDDPSRIGVRWRWQEIQNAGLMPNGYVDECLQDLTRLNPTYYANTGAVPETQALMEKAVTVDPSVNQVFSGYWNNASPADVDKVPGVVMTIMQPSLGPSRGQWGEAAVRLLFNNAPDGDSRRGKPIFVQAQRVTLPTSLPLGQDTFNLYYHYGLGYPNGYALNDCTETGPTDCNNNILVGTYKRTFLPPDYRSASVEFLIDTTKLSNGAVPGAPTINGAATPAYLLKPSSPPPASQTLGSLVTRTSPLQEVSVNQYVCQVLPPAQTCSVWVSWAGNGIGKVWRRNLSTLSYGTQAIDEANVGFMEQVLNHGDRIQFELWQGTPGGQGSVLLDKAPEVRAVGPTPPSEGPITVPNAPIQSNLVDLPAHQPWVGALAGEAGVSGGAGTYSVPIVVPPGRNGMAPDVALSYSSRGGNAIAGLGWSLSAGGSISRCPRTLDQDGGARGVRMDAEDRLCLDGQRLVRTADSINGVAYGISGARYRTEIDSFARVTQSGASLGNSGVCFTVEYKNGRTATFGCAPAGSSCSGGVAPQVRPQGQLLEQNWLLSRVADPTGNYMDYCYKQGGSESSEVLLHRIRYTGSTQPGSTSTQSDPSRLVVFGYEARPTEGLANDQGSSWLAEGAVYQTQRLKSISTFAPGSLLPVRVYKLDYFSPHSGYKYSPYSGRSLLQAIQECSFDPQHLPTSGTEVCRQPTRFTWSESHWEFSRWRYSIDAWATNTADPPSQTLPEAQIPTYQRQQVVPIGDLDGDGTREVLTTTSVVGGRTWQLRGQLAKTTADRQVSGIATLSGFEYVQAHDIDGDGAAELISGNKIYKWKGLRGAPACSGGAASCTVAMNSYFQVVTTNLPLGSNATPEDGPRFLQAVADFNADGAPDVLVRQAADKNCDGTTATRSTLPEGTTALCLFLNLRPGAISSTTTTFNFGAPLQLATLDASSTPEAVHHITDFNGDGTTDVIIADFTGVKRWIRGNLDDGQLTYSNQFFGENELDLELRRYVRWMDINGDGLDDAVMAHLPGGNYTCSAEPCFGQWRLQLNKGGKLSAVITPTGQSPAHSPGLRFDNLRGSGSKTFRYYSKMIRADIDADGRADLLYPAKFAARMCFNAKVSGTMFTPPQTKGCNPYCSAEICAASPPEDGTDYDVLQPDHKTVEAFRNGFGESDPSSYHYKAIRFVQTGAESFRLQVDETPIIAATSNLGNQRGVAEDHFGDGLVDIVSDLGCPFLSSTAFPGNTCLLKTGAGIGPGTPSSTLDSRNQIQLSSLENPANLNVLINENIGDGARTNLAPMFPDMLVKAVDAVGDTAVWDYFPLSSHAGRSADFPLYTIDTGYIDSRHFLFRSSMPVVSTLSRSSGKTDNVQDPIGARSFRFAYEGAMYNAAGRGFQGFRKISVETIAPSGYNLRTATTFHQKFPLTGRIERVERSIPGVASPGNRLSLDTFDWRCDRSNVGIPCPGQSGDTPAFGVTYWPYLNSSVKRSYDPASAAAGTQLPLGRVETFNRNASGQASGWTAEGNLEYTRTVARDGNGVADNGKYLLAQHETITENIYDLTQAGAWWLDRLSSSTTTSSVSYIARENELPLHQNPASKSVSTTQSWNPDRTLLSTTVADVAPGGQTRVTTYGYPTPSFGLPDRVVVTGTDVTPARETRTVASSDGYFPAALTNVLSAATPALNHTATSVIRASDGQVESATDPNGIKVTSLFDAFGRATTVQKIAADGTTQLEPPLLQALSECSGCGVPSAVYMVTTVKDGAPSQRSWHDLLGREVRRSTRGFDGRWVNVATAYEAMGAVLNTSAPYFDGESPLLTEFTYDRTGRVKTQRSPSDELLPNQGRTLTSYTYAGLRTDVSVNPETGGCTAANLCFTVKRQHNILGQLMRTQDALAGTYGAGEPLGGITDFWYDPLGNTTALRDGKGNVSSAIYNGFGQRTSSSDPNQGNWAFTYNALGELLTQTDARGVRTTVLQRDGMGRTLQQRREPTLGVPASLTNETVLDSWQYDAMHAKGQLASLQRQRSTAGGSPSGTPDWQESYDYQPNTSRLIKRTTQIKQAAPNLLSLAYHYAYDPHYGYLSAVTYPNLPQPLTVWKRYSRFGALTGLVDARLMTPMWSMTEADAYGKPTREQFGYALVGSASYNRATGRVRGQQWRPYDMPTYAGTLDELTYEYDLLGNLATQNRKWRRYDAAGAVNNQFSDSKSGYATETYSYDKLQRLFSVYRVRGSINNGISAQEILDKPTIDYAYDAVGNITKKTDFADVYTYGLPGTTVGLGGNCGPNALKTAVQLDKKDPLLLPLQTRNYSCDANGNQIGESGTGGDGQSRTLVYDGANLPTRIQHSDHWSGGIAVIDYAYGPGNARYVRSGEGGTLYFGADGYEREIGSGGTQHRIELGPVVYTRLEAGTATQPSRTSYQLRDRLGSTIAIADRWGHFNGPQIPGTPGGSVDGLTRRSYDPFGAPRNPTLDLVSTPSNYVLPTLQLAPTTRRGFTGHEHVDRAKLIHMNGRGYDYRSGRFMSVDPFIQFPGDSQSLNAYTYILNNPLSGTDPTGYAACVSHESDDCPDLGPARQRFTNYADFAFGGIVVIGGGENGNGSLKDPLEWTTKELIEMSVDRGGLSGRTPSFAAGTYDDPELLGGYHVTPKGAVFREYAVAYYWWMLPNWLKEKDAWLDRYARAQANHDAIQLGAMVGRTSLIGGCAASAGLCTFVDVAVAVEDIAAGNYEEVDTAFLLSRAGARGATATGMRVAGGSASTAKGMAADAMFAQKTYGSMFSMSGNFAGKSVDDIANALRSGAMKVSSVPVDYIVRDGKTIILNTRSAQALEAAGIARSEWNAVNRTGVAAFEGRLTDQLLRNPGGPFETVRRSGTH